MTTEYTYEGWAGVSLSGDLNLMSDNPVLFMFITAEEIRGGKEGHLRNLTKRLTQTRFEIGTAVNAAREIIFGDFLCDNRRITYRKPF